MRVCVCEGGRGGRAYCYINSNLLRNDNLTISFSISDRSCENSQPAVQLLLSMSSALRYFHDVNSVVTD